MKKLRKKNLTVRPNTDGWQVEVVQATSRSSLTRAQAERMSNQLMSYYDVRYQGEGGNPIKGCVAVRLVYNGQPSMTYGCVQIDAEDFEERVTTLKAEALEKAATLAAVGATG